MSFGSKKIVHKPDIFFIIPNCTIFFNITKGDREYLREMNVGFISPKEGMLNQRAKSSGTDATDYLSHQQR